MNGSVQLCGITWAHSRGYTPLIAASEAWHDLHPDVRVTWDKRSFWGFGEGPLDEVVRDYDLIVFDHPHTGAAAERGLLLPLDAVIEVPPCAGPSRESYQFNGRLYGLPIDGACQSAACRPELLEALSEPVPSNWTEVLSLARRTGKVRCAFSPMGAMGMFHSLTAGMGAPAGSLPDRYVAPDAAALALEQLRQLFLLCGPESLTHSPVRILGDMASTDSCLYAPLLYGYSNYCRPGFAPHLIRFNPPPIHPAGAGATLGGAGLGISSFSRQRPAAVEFAAWLISVPCQKGLYLSAQGQPALREAWLDDDANRLTGGFFRELLPVMDQAYLRPTWPGFSEFQTVAARSVHGYLTGKNDLAATLGRIDHEYRSSLSGVTQRP